MAGLLRKSHIRYRTQEHIFGRPDFYLVGHSIVIFCDSAFWHGYGGMQTKRHLFKRNKSFWQRKIRQNIERDKLVNNILRRKGYKVLRYWDFEIEKNGERCVLEIRKTINTKR